MKPNIFFVSLGCDKNLVDSERMLGLIDDAGMGITNDESEADVIVINTCGFINDAKQESIDTILEMAEYKKTGNLKALIVTGCLSERYKDELIKELPEVDGVLGTTNYDEIVSTIEKALNKERVSSFRDINDTTDIKTKRIVNTATAYAYLKIAEGCDNCCTYCIIPKLRGKLRSRQLESLVEEAKELVAQGKSEIILVAQDTTKYGLDLYGTRKLPDLIRELCKIEDLKWLRILYCYPEDITDELIQVIKEEPKVVKYIDMPIQHVNDTILKRMARKSSGDTVRNIINKLREEIPEICIRSTLITGFPGETQEQYEDLKRFVMETAIDRLGVFAYSQEEGTAAAEMEEQVDEDIKEARKNELMEIQQQISYQNNQYMIDEVIDVIIEGYLTEEEVYCGRSYKDAPNVDSMVFVSCDYDLLCGQIVKVRILEANEYDLIGAIEDEYSE